MRTRRLERIGTQSERLRSQADVLQARAFELRREAEDLLAEALELRNDADRLERAPIARAALRVAEAPPAFAQASAEREAALARQVCAALARGPLGKQALADHLGLSSLRVRAILDKLVNAGTVERFGITSGTRYALAPEPEPVAEPTTAEPENAELHVFTKELCERDLRDRRLAYTTAAPAELPEGAVPEPAEV